MWGSSHLWGSAWPGAGKGVSSRKPDLPFIRGKACRGQGVARHHDEWRPVEGESDETGVGAVSRVQSFPTSLHLRCCGAWPPCGGGEWEHQFPGDSGREWSNSHEGSRSREIGAQVSHWDSSRPPIHEAPSMGLRSLHYEAC